MIAFPEIPREGVDDDAHNGYVQTWWTFRVVGAYVSRRIMPIDGELVAEERRKEREGKRKCVIDRFACYLLCA